MHIPSQEHVSYLGKLLAGLWATGVAVDPNTTAVNRQVTLVWEPLSVVGTTLAKIGHRKPMFN